MQSSRVYESLGKLANLGLISYVIEANCKLYRAENPQRIIQMVEELKSVTTNILPMLQDKWNSEKTEQKATIYEGYKGLRTLFDRVLQELKAGEEHLVFSATKQPENFVAYFEHWNKERIKRKIMMRIAYSEDAKNQILETTKNKFVKYREIPKEFATPTTIDIFNNSVAFVLWTNNPIAFVIESKTTADSFRKYFELLWKKAKN